MLAFLQDLAAHAAWADSIFFKAWGNSPAVEHEEMRRRAGHMVGVQSGFVTVLKGGTPGGPPSGPPPSFADLKSRFRTTHDATRDLVKSLSESDLSRTVRIPWFPEPPCVITVPQALVQAAMHSQHHRGQCMTRLKDFAGQPENVDWIIWHWKLKPEAAWQR